MTTTILSGDCRELLKTLPDRSVQMCLTSPPYFGLRQYLPNGHEDAGKEIGLEQTPDAYVAELVAVFREVRRVLRDDGVLFLNLGDSYANDTKWGGKSGGKHVAALHGDTGIGRGKKHTGLKDKDLIGIPWMTAFALRADGWYLRSDCIWHKPNPMPESVTDRPTKSHEYVFLLTKSARYFWDADAVKEPSEGRAPEDRSHKDGGGHSSPQLSGRGGFGGDTRNLRSVWTIATQPFSGSHFATMPPDLAERCIKAGSRPGDTVLDPFGGSGTTGLVADRLGRNAVLIDLNPQYRAMARDRIVDDAPLFAEVAD